MTSVWFASALPITKTMSNTFSALMTMYVVTTTIVGKMLGTMIRLNTWNSDAPSMRAASMISSGIDLIAADSTTMANPVWIQTMITIRSRLFHGRLGQPRDRLLAERRS